MNATIKTGGKQYNVKVGQFFDIEKIDAKVGDVVTFDPIFISDGDKIEADPKKAAKVKVKAEVLEQHKDKKKIVFKFKRRKNYKVKNGHRQQLTKIKIVAIGDEKLKSKKESTKKTSTKKITKKVNKATTNSTKKIDNTKKAAEKNIKENTKTKESKDNKKEEK